LSIPGRGRSASRREFLKTCAATVPGLLLASHASAEKSGAGAGSRTPATLDRYIDRLPVPRLLLPQNKQQEKTEYRVRMLACAQQMHSQLTATRLWGYEGQYPGPTIEAFRNERLEVRWENLLPRQHLFSIDPHVHGAMPPAPAVRTVPHLHGSCTDSKSDGLPESWFLPGFSALYQYPNNQQAATLWYHDHAVGATRLNVYAGLSGFYLLRDERERSLNLPSGEYEIPLLLQDRTLDDQAQLVYSPTMEDGLPLPPGTWGPEFFGDLPVVNGAIYPYHEAEPRPYRLRVLNGCNSRFLRLFFNLAARPTDIPSLVSFHQIGSDGGLLPGPAPLSKLLLGPAERADLILDLSGLAGKTITLSNDAPAPYPGWTRMNSPHAALSEFMQIRVTLPEKEKARAFSLPPTLPLPDLESGTSMPTRQFVLSEKLDADGQSLGVRIDGKGYDDPVSEYVKLSSVERWRFINTTDDAHPMHLHLVQFRIVERQGYDGGALKNGQLKLVGTPRLPLPNEAGWKDTAVVTSQEVLTILVRFEGFTGRYLFHCHMLEHEDNDMMRPFEVT
jgi:spore coat protein A